jgi:predicted dehydrogenase
MAERRKLTRRRFLKKAVFSGAGAFALPYIVTASSIGSNNRASAGERITVGCIGVGAQGSGVMGNFLAQPDVQIAAVCDVKSWVREAARKRVDEHYGGRGCAAYGDFRELLARADIDVVLIATPDHWHVPIALAAAKAGKDIYLEKPMGLSLSEDQALRQAIHSYRTVFQFGTQQRSDAKFRFACELVRNGRIGELRTINVWCPPSITGGSTQPAPVPEGLDYDMWIGPAPYVPYTPERCSNEFWWYISDYALGFIAGWGVHPLDIALWGGGGKLDGAVEVEGRADFPSEGVCDTAVKWNVVFRFRSGVVINYTNDPMPVEWRQRYGAGVGHGTAFEGSEGWVCVDRERIQARPEPLLESGIGPNEIHLTRSDDHVRDLLDCVRSRARTVCPVEEAVRADILCHLSDIATRLPGRLIWDQQRERFINNDNANRLLVRCWRSPWRI